MSLTFMLLFRIPLNLYMLYWLAIRGKNATWHREKKY
jgi:hypothetical protein